ncbi:MAG: MFS transporter [Oscillospiraceae bacterium]
MKKRLLHFSSPSPEMRTALNLAALQGFFWFGWSFSCYGTVYLQNNGFPASDLGALNAISSTVAIFAMMLWGLLSDKINSIKFTFLFALVGTAVFHGLIPFLPTGTPYTIIIFFLYYPFVNFFRCSLATLLDNLTVRSCAEKQLNYGVIRALGSFTFTIGSFVIVALIPYTGVGASFWLSGLLMIPALLSLLFSHDPKMVLQKNAHKVKVSPKPLFKNYFYVTFLIFAAIIYVAFSAEFSFITYFMEDIGVPNSNFGTLLAVRAVMEVPLLLVIVKLRKKFHLKYLIMLACTLMASEGLFLGLTANGLTSMLICGALFGLGNGLFLGTVSLYLFKLSPDNLKASAQTIFAAVSSVSGIVGNLVGGFAYELFGGRTFYILLGCIILFGVGIFALTLALKKNLPNPGDLMESR